MATREYCDHCDKLLEASRLYITDYCVEGAVRQKHFWWCHDRWTPYFRHHRLCKECYAKFEDHINAFLDPDTVVREGE